MEVNHPERKKKMEGANPYSACPSFATSFRILAMFCNPRHLTYIMKTRKFLAYQLIRRFTMDNTALVAEIEVRNREVEQLW